MTDKPTWDEVGPELVAELRRLAESFGWQEDHPALRLVARAEQIGKE